MFVFKKMGVCVCTHITFFGYTLPKTCIGVTLTQNGLSCGQHSPRSLTENKETIKSFNLKITKINKLLSDINCMYQSKEE